MQPRTAVVTGASRGIGPYIARALADHGLSLLLVARSEAELVRLATELGGRHNKVAIAAVDLGAADAAAQVATTALAEFGSVDVLVNNAAIEPQTRFHVLTAVEIETVLRVDLVTPMTLSRLLLPGMLDRGYGRIVNISSLAGHNSFPFTEAYAAAKDGLIAFSRVLRNDYRRTGVSASCVIVGAVKHAGLTARTLEETGLKTTTAFFVKPERVAAATIRAIDKNKAEIVVTPGPGRILKALLDYFPGLGPAMNRISGVEKLMGSVADHRENSRPDRSASSAASTA